MMAQRQIHASACWAIRRHQLRFQSYRLRAWNRPVLFLSEWLCGGMLNS